MFKSLFSDTIKPLLKSAGFKNKGLSFYKIHDQLIYLIHFQNSQHNTSSHIDFFVNCGIHSIEMDAQLGKDKKSEPKEYECYFSKRIEKITAFEKSCFTINSETDMPKLEIELKHHLLSAIDFLIQIDTTEKLADLMIDQNGLQNFQELLSFLIKTNRTEHAKKLIGKLQNDFGSDSRWPFFEKQIASILAQNNAETI